MTVCDDAGCCFPDEFAALIEEVKGCCGAKVFAQPSDALGMAAACAVEAIKAGADGVKTAVSNKSYLCAEVFADICRAKGDSLGFACKLDVTGIHRLLSEALPEEAAEQAAAEEVKANSAFSALRAP